MPRGRPKKKVVESKPGAKRIEVKGNRVRSREDHPIVCSVHSKAYGEKKVTLYPDTATEVPDEILAMLKLKFSMPREILVPDAEANEKNPHKAGQAPIHRVERRDNYVIEGLDEL